MGRLPHHITQEKLQNKGFLKHNSIITVVSVQQMNTQFLKNKTFIEHHAVYRLLVVFFFCVKDLCLINDAL